MPPFDVISVYPQNLHLVLCVVPNPQFVCEFFVYQSLLLSCKCFSYSLSLQASSIRSRCRRRPAWTRERPRGARARPRLPALGSYPGWEPSDVSVNVNKTSEDMERSLLNVCCVFQWRRVMAVRLGVAALCVKRKTWQPIRRKDAPGAQAPPIRKREWAARKSMSTVLVKVKDINWLW